MLLWLTTFVFGGLGVGQLVAISGCPGTRGYFWLGYQTPSRAPGRVGYNGRSNGRPEIYLLSAALTTSNLALLLASKGIGSYIRQHFLDKTFQGLYQVNAFDMALLIPYFIVLVLLASYGLHRYVLVYLYYKNRKNRTVRSRRANLPSCRE